MKRNSIPGDMNGGWKEVYRFNGVDEDPFQEALEPSDSLKRVDIAAEDYRRKQRFERQKDLFDRAEKAVDRRYILEGDIFVYRIDEDGFKPAAVLYDRGDSFIDEKLYSMEYGSINRPLEDILNKTGAGDIEEKMQHMTPMPDRVRTDAESAVKELEDRFDSLEETFYLENSYIFPARKTREQL